MVGNGAVAKPSKPIALRMGVLGKYSFSGKRAS
jgi:hypothetical protein